MAQLSVQEQLMLEMVNRARLDPLAEAKRLGIDLNKDLSPGTLNGDAKQVLAPNLLLVDSARFHSQYMIDTDQFAHEGIGDGTPRSRMEDAGYVFSGSWAYGENVAYNGSTGPIDATATTVKNHEGLFRSAGHRLNILADDFRELGIGNVQGVYSNGADYNVVMTTQNFALSGSDVFVTGVCINDADGDDFYDVGEQRAGITVELRQGGTLVDDGASSAAGGYVLAAPAGVCAMRFSGGDLAKAVNCTVDTSGGNVKVDLSGVSRLLSSGDITLGAGARHATLLGVAALDATGNADANTLIGNKGGNLLKGLDGGDNLQGGNGADTLQGGAGADRLNGGAGKDTLTGNGGADLFDFNTVNDAGKPGAPHDLVGDFQQGTDRIDLAGIDAVKGGGNDAFDFIGTDAFSGTPGELRYALQDVAGTTADRTVITGDVNGDGAADFQFDLAGLFTLTAADFIL
jgi:Ca2+-binding RTX toxin-like protein